MGGGRKLDAGHAIPGYDGWETCDIRPGADHQVDIGNISILGKFDEILCNMVLEHVPPWQINEVLEEFYLALNDGGFVDIIVPDFDDIIRLFKGNPNEALHRLFGGSMIEGGPDDCYEQEHRWAFTEYTLACYLQESGFKNVYSRMEAPVGILWMRAYK